MKKFVKLIIQGSAAGSFQVTLVKQEDILDFKTWASLHFKKQNVQSVESRHFPRT